MKHLRGIFLLLLFAGTLHCQYERVDDVIPPLDFTWMPQNQIGIEEPVSFIPNTPFDADYLWEFSDEDTSTLSEPEKYFFQGGRHSVKLTVTLDGGGTLTRTKVIFIDPFKHKMNPIPGGTFQMGCNELVDLFCELNEHPRHQVTLQAFFMGATEVTQNEWVAVTGQNPSTFTGCGECPVETVSWNDIQAFIDTLSSLSGFNYSLPSEAQWEHAARAGDTSLIYSGSNDLSSVGWWGNPSGFPQPVGTLAPNAWGLYDMSGNIFEWCEDYVHNSYTGAPSDGSAWLDPPDPNGNRVLRGGAWLNGESFCRVSSRSLAAKSEEAWNFIGFRLARD